MELFIQIIIFASLMLGLLVIFEILGIQLNPPQKKEVLLGSATIEAMYSGKIGPNPDLAIDMSEFKNQIIPEKSFCSSGGENLNQLESECNELSKENCSKVSCCGYLNNTKCVNGNQFGPTFRSDNNGKNINIDTYYYMNKCLGPKC
jgi:hypothetical protein